MNKKIPAFKSDAEAERFKPLLRFLLGMSIAFALASCGGAPAQSPYDQDCSSTTCNGHMMPNNFGIGY